jgi:LysM repeat protein
VTIDGPITALTRDEENLQESLKVQCRSTDERSMARISRFVALIALLASALALPLVLPAATASAASSTYVVKNGDSLFGIATKLHVPLNDLLSANGLTIASTILPGQQLQVPGAATPAAPAAPATGGSYLVKSGDSLGRIASKHQVSLTSLLAVNGMTTSSLILPGQTITLPAGAVVQAPAAPPAPATGGSYLVKSGDSLGRIASKHQVSLTSLLAANGMTTSSLILPGQTITLPAGAVIQAPAAPAAPATGGSYVVLAGDSLGRIASRHAVTLAALLAVNRMTAASLILPGQTITLPSGARLSTPNAGSSPAPATGSPIDIVVSYALAQQGKPYQFFSAGPDTFDCSGLTKAAYARIGVSLIHHSASQARQGRAVDFVNEPIQAGDLIFLITRNNQVINHVGMAISSTQWIHAPAPGQPVRVGSIPSRTIIVAVRRFV